jgi:hypothetical protein
MGWANEGHGMTESTVFVVTHLFFLSRATNQIGGATRTEKKFLWLSNTQINNSSEGREDGEAHPSQYHRPWCHDLPVKLSFLNPRSGSLPYLDS